MVNHPLQSAHIMFNISHMYMPCIHVDNWTSDSALIINLNGLLTNINTAKINVILDWLYFYLFDSYTSFGCFDPPYGSVARQQPLKLIYNINHTFWDFLISFHSIYMVLSIYLHPKLAL